MHIKNQTLFFLKNNEKKFKTAAVMIGVLIIMPIKLCAVEEVLSFI